MGPNELPIPRHLIIANGVFTVVAFTLLLLILKLLGVLYAIGKFTSIYLIIILVTFELIKAIARRHLFESKRNSTPKTSTNSFDSILLIAVSLLVFYVVPVLFGAPLFADFEETLMFSTVLTTLTTVQCLIHLGYKQSVKILLGLNTVDAHSVSVSSVVLRNVQCTVFGAWSAAVVIPLDWNRAWQAWPIPCCIGALVGHVIGNFTSTALVLNRRGKLLYKKHSV
ncbi:PREDICTED: phosphatidylinositol-glycan biosynthesis class F protein [Nicrophorus vespilloides]|uniref:Phosphatidylinositol-glycan biosynthesis class F protein n=1 Tax=Nicrophorus vespilloides TaxID=110193 RepID=A0ABM1N6L3_NICVS|nr:PREDICTED: phosphatidylinositol-glycan biosynthesis class F protein [Nicrophorus vespilloides]XP_017782472.1 PREDICTED: phosphatidylinositol-glycan biosynthesis class F protein [Nicrophorus vespilloides]